MIVFLEIKFHDNDFGTDIIEAIRKIYGYIHSDIFHHSRDNTRTVTEAFLHLHEQGLLIQMIKKQVTALALWHDVEWCIRGIYNKEYKAMHKIKPLTEEVDHLQNYFGDMELEFHENGEFTLNWKNYEHTYIDLENGNSGVF